MPDISSRVASLLLLLALTAASLSAPHPAAAGDKPLLTLLYAANSLGMYKECPT